MMRVEAKSPRGIIISFPLIVLLALIISLSLGAQECNYYSWDWINPLPQGNDLNAITHDGSNFYAGGYEGTVLVSSTTDPYDWTQTKSPLNFNNNILVSAPDGIYAVGEFQTICRRNGDGGWDYVSSASFSIRGLIWDGTRFIAVGDGIATSPDCRVWTTIPSLPSSMPLFSIVYAGGKYIAVGDGGTILTSDDANLWTLQAPVTTYPLFHIIHGNGLFLVLGFTVILTSTDGQVWSVQTPCGTQWTTLYEAGTYGDGLFVVSGYNGCQVNNFLITSSDGMNWEIQLSNFPKYGTLHSIDFANHHFVAVGSAGMVLVSDDGRNWDQSGTDITGNRELLYSVTYGGGRFVAVGETGTILTSIDGILWNCESADSWGGLYSVKYLNAQYIAVGRGTYPNWSNGPVFLSSNGSKWFPRAVGITTDMRDVAYGNGRYVAVGWDWDPNLVCNKGIALVSLDGGWSWNPYQAGCENLLRTVTYGNGVFVAGGGKNTSIGAVILTSPDGITWTNRLTPVYPDNAIVSVAYGNGKFVALGDQGSVYSSTDGVNWQLDYKQSAWKHIVFRGGEFYRIQWPNNYTYSAEVLIGAAETSDRRYRTGMHCGPVELAVGPDKIVLVGAGGGILSADCDYTSPLSLSCDNYPRSGIAPLTVSFTASPFGGTGNYQYSWHFGDGSSISNMQNPAHTYTNPGHYYPYVVATSGGQQQTCMNTVHAIGDPPIVNSVPPFAGPPAGGTLVTVFGQNFGGALSVKFGDVSAIGVTVVSESIVSCISPPHAPGQVHVTVTTALGTSDETTADIFEYIPAPSVTSVTPNTGPIQGGIYVTITGTDFYVGGSSSVDFGGIPVTFLASYSRELLVTKSPAQSTPGATIVHVQTPSGVSPDSPGSQYYYFVENQDVALTITEEENITSLTWNSQVGYSYYVFRGINPQVFELLDTVTTSPFKEPSGASGSLYFYRVEQANQN